MIEGAFHHLPGLGPERIRQVTAGGLATWSDLRGAAAGLPLGVSGCAALLRALDDAERAARADDLAWMVRTFAPEDHWRILATYFDRAAFFDIETTGLEAGSRITMIACRHPEGDGVFVQGRNLDDFLSLMDRVELLVSFNGASFDVPRVEDHFRIPSLPCPHLDLRWILHRAGWRGGLKRIERRLGLVRPDDLHGVDGEEAVWLWRRWECEGDAEALARLQRYVEADVAGLQEVAARFLASQGSAPACPPPARLRLPKPPPAAVKAPAIPSVTTRDAGAGSGGAPCDPLARRLAEHWHRLRQRRNP